MAAYTCFRYTCSCGEKVTAFRLPVNLQVNIPQIEMTVDCSNGHTRMIREDQFGQLERWEESEFNKENRGS